jgi:hypothetical protein
MTSSLKLIPVLEIFLSFLYNPGMNKRQTKNGFYRPKSNNYCGFQGQEAGRRSFQPIKRILPQEPSFHLHLSPLLRGGKKKHHGSIR